MAKAGGRRVPDLGVQPFETWQAGGAGLITGAGVTLGRVAAFARAAAVFYASPGWRHLSREDPVRIEAPEVEADLRHFVLDARVTLDLVFAARPGELLDDEEETGEWQGFWMLDFAPPWGVPLEDFSLWEKHGLPRTVEGFLPAPMFMGLDAIRRPDRRQLAFFEGLLSALAATTEADLDAGRWEKQVSTADGPVRFILSLPGRLEPEIWPDCADAYDLLAGRAPNPTTLPPVSKGRSKPKRKKTRR